MPGVVINNHSSLKRATVSAAKWSVLSELATRLIQPIVFLVMARLLTPEDYGVIGAAGAVLSLSQVLWDTGLGRALIQRENDVECAANVVFWTNLFLAIVVSCFLLIAADWIATFIFKDARVAAVIRVQGLALPLGACASVQTALFQRHLKFKNLFWIRLISIGAPGLASIPLALTGAGYWALVVGVLAGALVQTLSLWRASVWRPSWTYDWNMARSLIRFGFWVMLSSLLAWMILWMDVLLIGMFMNSATLGLYRTGTLFVTTIFTLFLGPIMPVLYSYMSRLQGDPIRLKATLLRVNRLVFLFSALLGAGLFLVRQPLAEVVFGSRWAGVGEVIGWFGLSQGLSWLVSANMESYRAMGRPDIETKVMLIGVVIYIPVYAITAAIGLREFLYVRFLLSVVWIALHWSFCRALLQISPVAMFKCIWRTLLGMVSVLLLTWVSPWLTFSSAIVRLVLLTLAGGGIYLMVAGLPQRRFIQDEIKTILQKPKAPVEGYGL
jgi:O-antigen/teichoic acid export membrane protein